MRRPGRSLWAILTLAICAALCAVAPLSAYTIYLKDGKTVQAKTKYVVRDGKAYITLPSGTQTFLDAKLIDVQRTEQANRKDYGGSAVVLDQGTAPPPGPQAPPPPRRKTLSELIATRGPETRDLPEARRETASAEKQTARTRAGFSDFSQMTRSPYGQGDVASELQQFFRGQGVEEVQIHAGSSADRPMIEITTNSEGSVFRALAIGANALLNIHDRFPGKVAAFELLLMTPTRERAGQFVLTPDMAADLISKKVELTAFYVQNVQF